MSDVHAELRRVVLPMVSKNKEDGSCRCHGTGFVIIARGQFAYVVTAAHVLEDIRRIETPNPYYHPTTPDFFRPIRFQFLLQRVTPLVLFPTDAGEVVPAIIHEAVEMPKADIALCWIEFAPSVPSTVQFEHRFCLDTRPVEMGDEVRVFGYNQVTLEDVDSADSLKRFTGAWGVRVGTVGSVYPRRGPTGQEHPCFQIDAPLESGMSGGPALTVDRDNIPCVRGIVRSDESRAENPTSSEPLLTALISMLWPLMLMPLRGPDVGGVVGEQKLLQLDRGLIEDQGAARQHIRYRLGENGQVTCAEWTRDVIAPDERVL
jgi:hypothetical protein